MSISLNIQRLDSRKGSIRSAVDQLRRRLSPRGDVVSDASRQRTIEVFGEPLSPAQVVARICQEVQEQGIAAVLKYTRLLDQAEITPETLRVSPEALNQAHQQADPEFLQTIRRIKQNILEFQTAILHRDTTVTRPNGVTLRQRYVPLRRIGVCVPGGAAAYPSTVLMSAVPAQAAGVGEIAIVAPPTRFGSFNTDLLATCQELGVREVYRVGGAQAIAALAFGVDGIAAVDKIVGPGNLFVALAKKLVYGEVDIDSIAGPSEVVVLADRQANATFIAADLLAQAEHSPGSSVLIVWEDGLLEAVESELNRLVATLERCDLTVRSLEDYGALIRVGSAEEACELTDLFAPEHLHIATANAAELCERIHNAGATFLGNFSPVALGDYAAGPSHVLPTSGTARWASGLSANDFLRAGSVIEYTESAFREIAEDVQRMATKESLTAHRLSVDVRVGDRPSS